MEEILWKSFFSENLSYINAIASKLNYICNRNLENYENKYLE